jgi:hypothetical protein
LDSSTRRCSHRRSGDGNVPIGRYCLCCNWKRCSIESLWNRDARRHSCRGRIAAR